MYAINLPIVPIAVFALYRLAKSSSAASTPAPYPCPDLDGSSYIDATGSNYHIQCSTDYSGNDLPAVHTDTFEECLKACDTYVPGSSAEAHSYASCIGVSWGAGNPGGNCYLKYNITTINRNDVGFSSGYYANKTLPGSGVQSLSSNPSTTSATTSSITEAAATSSTKAATSSIEPTPKGGSGSHVGVGVGAGVAAGVVVGAAILAGYFYLKKRQSKRGPELPPEMDAEENGKNYNKFHEPSSEKHFDELPAEYRPPELFDPRGPRPEMG